MRRPNSTYRSYEHTSPSSSDDFDFLFEHRDVLFQGQLVEEFIQAFGLYPTGTLVELSNGAVALIQSQNDANRLQPEMLLVLDQDKQQLEKFVKINLRDQNEKSDQVLSIKRALSVGEFDLDSNKLMRSYTSQKRGWANILSFGN